MRWIASLALVAFLVAAAAFAWLGIPATAAGLAAKSLCSGMFLAGRRQQDVVDNDLLPASGLLRFVDLRVDPEQERVRGRMLWSRERTAMRLPGLGCVLDPTPELLGGSAAAGRRTIGGDAGVLPGVSRPPPLPTMRPGPDRPGSAVERLAAVVDEAFQESGDAAGRNTRAVVVLHRGRLLAERYGSGFDATTPQIGWSMSKTVLGLLVYRKLGEQGLAATVRAVDWVAPHRRPPWLREWLDDERRSITLADLLFMRDGLDHAEGYQPWSAVPRMLWGSSDVASYAGSAPLQDHPGRRFRYLSATANVLSGLLRLQFDSDGAYWRYPAETVFGPIGADSAVMEVDAGGTFIASSYTWATARDWARIGQLLLDDGLAGDARILPAGWQAFAGTPPPSDDPAAMGYGAHVWLPGRTSGSSCGPSHGLPADVFLMTGHWGQLAAVIPSRQAVIVRLGMTTDRSRFDRCAFLRSVIDVLPEARAGMSPVTTTADSNGILVSGR